MMDREIKFRGMDSMTGKWVHGNLIIMATGSNYIISQNFIGNEIPQWLVDRDTVGQYTGLKDRNDHEIYEGDIVSMFGGTQFSVVEWDKEYGLFKIYLQLSGVSQVGEELLGNHLKVVEVIGNIFEDPEKLGAIENA